jgi:ribosome-associated translation inhibitor RaiA
MRLPLQITFRNLDKSEALAQRIRARVEELDSRYPRLVSCRVMVEAPHRHHHKGALFHVRIELGVPGRELVISSDVKEAKEHHDPYVAVRDAFDAARRRLDEFARRQRGETKSHPL